MSASRRAGLTPTSRVLVAITLVMTAAFAVLVVVAYVVSVNRLTNSLDAVLVQEAEAYAAAMAGAPAADALSDATRAYLRERTGSRAGLDPVLLVSLETSAGPRVISNSTLRLEKSAGNTALAEPLTARRSESFTYGGVRYRAYAVPVESRGKLVGVFQAALSEDIAIRVGRSVALALIAAGLIALGCGLPLAYLATRGALAPLTRMATDASDITWRKPGKRIAYDGPATGELSTLATALNAMLDRLEQAYDDQRAFVADASHELRTPLAIVRGNVELLRRGGGTAEDTAEGLRVIEDETVRMGRLLDELLALARLESAGRHQFQPLAVDAVLDELVGRARALGSRNFVRAPRCGLWIEGDPDLIEQALANIARNAVGHTTEGGTIDVGCSSESGRVRITITDDGPGIPAEELERIFDRFHRVPGTSRTEEGCAGLGLAIAKRLIELHGGTIIAENADPHGARFVIELPLAEEPS